MTIVPHQSTRLRGAKQQFLSNLLSDAAFNNELGEATRDPKQPRPKLSKAELREQAAAAFLAWREGQTTKDK